MVMRHHQCVIVCHQRDAVVCGNGPGRARPLPPMSECVWMVSVPGVVRGFKHLSALFCVFMAHNFTDLFCFYDPRKYSYGSSRSFFPENKAPKNPITMTSLLVSLRKRRADEKGIIKQPKRHISISVLSGDQKQSQTNITLGYIQFTPDTESKHKATEEILTACLP